MFAINVHFFCGCLLTEEWDRTEEKGKKFFPYFETMPHQSSRLFGKVKVMRDGEKRKATRLHKSRGRKKGRMGAAKGLLCCLLGTVPQTNWTKKEKGRKGKWAKPAKAPRS